MGDNQEKNMKINLSSPDIKKADINSVKKVLLTPHLSLGPSLKEFERNIAKYVKVKYAIGVSNGTAALHLIIRALNIKDGDEVITTPFSFIASTNCLLYERAKPVFVDICKDTLNIDTDMIEKRITKKTKAILAVDVFGNPCDWIKLKSIAKKYNLKLIEDSAEALGSSLGNRKCGSFADAGILSFYPNKQITTGEGGMIVTNSKEISTLCRSLSNQGRVISGGCWKGHIFLGYNYRLSDINASLGISQLSRIESILRKRAAVAGKYNEFLSSIDGIKLLHQKPGVKIGWFVYVIRLTNQYSRKDRDLIIENLAKEGIQCSNYFSPIHLHPFYRKIFNYKRGSYPVCESESDRCIALPFHNNLKEKEIKYIVDKLQRALCIVS